jgi:hypothetical protein
MNNRKKLNQILRERNKLRSQRGYRTLGAPQQELERLQNNQPMTMVERLKHYGVTDPLVWDILGR